MHIGDCTHCVMVMVMVMAMAMVGSPVSTMEMILTDWLTYHELTDWLTYHEEDVVEADLLGDDTD